MTRIGIVRALLAIAALTACAGPQAKVTIEGQQVPLSVSFGKPRVPGVTPKPVRLVPGPSGVGIVEVPAGPNGNEPPPPSYHPPTGAGPCPTPPPGSAAPEAAPSTVRGVPKDAFATLRVSRSTTDAHGTIAQTERGSMTTGSASTAPGGSTTFTISQRLFGVDSVSQIETVPPSFNGPAQANTGLIALRSVSGDSGLGYQQSFKPTTPLQVFSQPAYAGASWTSTSTDPTTQSVAQVDGQVVAEEPVLACGSIVDTWRTETHVHVTNPSQDIKTTVTTWFATQHGGLPLAQTQSYQGTAGGEAVSGTVSWVIDFDNWAS